jgi:hypothetical protein
MSFFRNKKVVPSGDRTSRGEIRGNQPMSARERTQNQLAAAFKFRAHSRVLRAIRGNSLHCVHTRPRPGIVRATSWTPD